MLNFKKVKNNFINSDYDHTKLDMVAHFVIANIDVQVYFRMSITVPDIYKLESFGVQIHYI